MDKKKRSFYKEIKIEIEECLWGLVGFMACTLWFNQAVCDKVEKLFDGASCNWGLFSITIESGMQTYRIVNWSVFLFVGFAISFISIYRKVRAQESLEIEAANSETSSTLPEITNDES